MALVARSAVAAGHGRVAQHARSVDQQGADLLQPRLYRRPVAADVFDELSQEEQIAQAAHLLCEPAGLVELRAQPRQYYSVTARH